MARLSDEDIKKAEDYIDLMTIMFTSTTAVSSETSPTIGQIVPTLQYKETLFAVYLLVVNMYPFHVYSNNVIDTKHVAHVCSYLTNITGCLMINFAEDC